MEQQNREEVRVTVGCFAARQIRARALHRPDGVRQDVEVHSDAPSTAADSAKAGVEYCRSFFS